MSTLTLALLRLNLNRHQIAFWDAKIKSLIMFRKMVTGGGIKPPIRGFSIEMVIDYNFVIIT